MHEDYWPTFAHLGEQEVLNQELYYDTMDVDDWNLEIFGYVPRYAEYRYNSSRVSGDFKNSLDFWHMGRIFGDRPALNAQFIECNPTSRIFAVDDESTTDTIWSTFHRISARRAIPEFGTPTF